jgi:transposase
LSPQQLFGWRRQLQSTQVAQSTTEGLQFVPAVAAAPTSAPVRRRRRARWCDAEPDVGIIEVEIAGVTVRIGRGAEAETVAAVLRLLKAGA